GGRAARARARGAAFASGQASRRGAGGEAAGAALRLRPELLIGLGVAALAEAADEQLEPVVAGLERPPGRRRHEQHVPGGERHLLVVEAGAAAAGEHDVDLLLARVPVAEAAAEAGGHPLVAESAPRHAERLASEARLEVGGEPVLLGRVREICDVPLLVVRHTATLPGEGR